MRGETPWIRLRAADLEAIKRNFPGYPYPDLLRAIEVSVEALERPTGSATSTWRCFRKISPSRRARCACSGNWMQDTRDCMDAFGGAFASTCGDR